MSQLTHHNTSFDQKQFPLVLILNGISSPANIGSIFRLADAFGVEKIILCGTKVDLSSYRLLRTARSTVEKVAFEKQEEVSSVCHHHISEGYALFALEITEESIPLNSMQFRKYARIGLIIGNERLGIRSDILKLTEKTMHISMFGQNSSMNVAQATAVALYEITRSLPHI